MGLVADINKANLFTFLCPLGKLMTTNVDKTFSCHGSEGRARNGTFCFLQDNHTSVQGMREKAASKGANVLCLSHDDAVSRFRRIELSGDDHHHQSRCTGTCVKKDPSSTSSFNDAPLSSPSFQSQRRNSGHQNNHHQKNDRSKNEHSKSDHSKEDNQNSDHEKSDYGDDGDCSRSLFVYPAQSNFSGRKYPLDWIAKIQESGLDLSDLW